MKQFLIIQFALLSSGLFALNPALSNPRIHPYFGSEFTFTNNELLMRGNPKIINSASAVKAQKMFAKAIEEICQKRDASNSESCQVASNRHTPIGIKVSYPDGWWFQISTDPKVIEVQSRPITLEEAYKLRDRIAHDIFDVAKSVGLEPYEFAGDGHIHMDLNTTFNDDVMLFRNFIVDIANHPHLSLGILNDDPYNAPPVALLGQEAIKNFKAVIEAFDSEFSAGHRWEIRKLAQKITDDVYAWTFADDQDPPEKYQILNLNRVISSHISSQERTVEMRGIRAQESADQYILELELLQSRINYLAQKYHNSPVPLFLKPVELKDASTAQLLDEFRDYFQPQGLTWSKMRNLLPEKLRTTKRPRESD